MNAHAKIETETQKLRAKVSHTDAHLTISVLDEDAHLFPHRYGVSMHHEQGMRVIRIAPTQGRGKHRGVRPGKVTLKGTEPWRRLQFQPLDAKTRFGSLDIELELCAGGQAKVTLPEELPVHSPNSGWMKRDRQAHQKDPNPVPEKALPAPAPVVSDRLTIAQAVKVVNAFLADTPGAELEVVKAGGAPDRIRVSIVEVFE